MRKMESELFWQVFPLSLTVLMADLLNFILTFIHKEGQLTDLKGCVIFKYAKSQRLLYQLLMLTAFLTSYTFCTEAFLSLEEEELF